MITEAKRDHQTFPGLSGRFGNAERAPVWTATCSSSRHQRTVLPQANSGRPERQPCFHDVVTLYGTLYNNCDFLHFVCARGNGSAGVLTSEQPLNLIYQCV